MCWCAWWLVLERRTFGTIHDRQLYIPGRYVLTTGFWYWTGRFDWSGEPVVSFDQDRAEPFVSARHAYERARGILQLQDYKAKRVSPRE